MWSMAGFLWHQSFKLPQTDDISGQGPSISPVPKIDTVMILHLNRTKGALIFSTHTAEGGWGSRMPAQYISFGSNNDLILHLLTFIAPVVAIYHITAWFLLRLMWENCRSNVISSWQCHDNAQHSDSVKKCHCYHNFMKVKIWTLTCFRAQCCRLQDVNCCKIGLELS